jgi:hypothetical protein
MMRPRAAADEKAAAWEGGILLFNQVLERFRDAGRDRIPLLVLGRRRRRQPGALAALGPDRFAQRLELV